MINYKKTINSNYSSLLNDLKTSIAEKPKGRNNNFTMKRNPTVNNKSYSQINYNTDKVSLIDKAGEKQRIITNNLDYMLNKKENSYFSNLTSKNAVHYNNRATVTGKQSHDSNIVF